LLLVVICLLLTACGSKGDLYLPEKPSKDSPQPSSLSDEAIEPTKIHSSKLQKDPEDSAL